MSQVEYDTPATFATFGQMLREARQRRGISMEKLARLIDVSTSSVAYWERDKGEPSLALGLRVITELDLDLEEVERTLSESARSIYGDGSNVLAHPTLLSLSLMSLGLSVSGGWG